MSRDIVYLLDILDSAKLAASYVAEITEDVFSVDTECQDAVIRRISVIGEAARRLSQQAANDFPGLPISQMVAMRNVLIHEYDGIDISHVWDTVQKDIPALIKKLLDILPIDVLRKE